MSRREGLDVTLGRHDLAFAFELRQGGAPWKLIAEQFGVSTDHLGRCIRRCQAEGLGWLKKP